MAEESEEEIQKIDDFMNSGDSDVDVLNVSFGEMHLDEASVEIKASTPVKDQSQSKKHPLTPSAKEREPSAKRRASVDEGSYQSSASTSTSSAAGNVNLSGFRIKKRRCSLASLIRENYEIDIGTENMVTQADMIQTLGLKPEETTRLSKTITKQFPEVEITRRVLAGTRKTVYCNVKRKTSLSFDSDSPKIVFPENSPIDNIKKAIGRLQEEQSTVNKEVTAEIEKNEEDWNCGYLKLLFDRQKKINVDISKYTDGLVNLYEKEMVNLIERDQVSKLSTTLKEDISSEVETFKKMLNLGLSTKTEMQIDGSLFVDLSKNLTKHCPLLFEIVECLLLVSSGGSVQTGRRVHSVSHALALLCSLSSQKITNDFKILFTLLCISHGAGMRFVGMLNHIGLTVSWKKAMQVLDDRMKKMQQHIKNLTPTDIAIILLMDNINIYKGKRKHLRIFKEFTPSMWNFTGRAVIIPFLSEDVKSKMQSKKEATESQKDVLKLGPSDILYNKDNKQDKVFENYRDYYILSAMDIVYNSLPTCKKRLGDMTEYEIDHWLAKSDFSKPKTKKYKLKIPNLEDIIDMRNSSRKTDAVVLPLSLEDNATIAGTTAILEEFETDFSLPSKGKIHEMLPYDKLNEAFDVNQARSHFEYTVSQEKHVSGMANFGELLQSREKELDGVVMSDISETETSTLNTADGVDNPQTPYTQCTLENERRRFRKEDEPFWDSYTAISS